MRLTRKPGPRANELQARIEETREKTVKVIIEQLQSTITKLRTTTGLCAIGDSDCIALMLGTLERSASQNHLWPLQDDCKLSFDSLSWAVQILKVQSLCGLPQKPAPVDESKNQ
jgi:hypothetical protein